MKLFPLSVSDRPFFQLPKLSFSGPVNLVSLALYSQDWFLRRFSSNLMAAALPEVSEPVVSVGWLHSFLREPYLKVYSLSHIGITLCRGISHLYWNIIVLDNCVSGRIIWLISLSVTLNTFGLF